MALIKSHSAAEVVNGAVVLDLGDLRRQGEMLQQRARAEADRILAEARAQAQRLIDVAHGEGFDAGFKKGHAAGLEAGRKQGHDSALKDSAARLQRLEEAWINAAQQWDAQRRAMLLEARQSLLTLAVAMAEKIVRRVPHIDPTVVADQVAEAIDHVARPCDVAIRIHPTDVPLVEQAMPKLLQHVHQVQHVTLIDDETVSPGGCVVTYGAGRIDATLDTQLIRLIDTLLPQIGSQSTEPPGPQT